MQPLATGALPGRFVAESLALAMDGDAVIGGDFGIDTPGRIRFAVLARKGIGGRKLGRNVQRLPEIETGKSNRSSARRANRRQATVRRVLDAQLRLQETVEGLSVVAITYYAVAPAGIPLAPVGLRIGVTREVVEAMPARPILLLVWLTVRRIRSPICEATSVNDLQTCFPITYFARARGLTSAGVRNTA